MGGSRSGGPGRAPAGEVLAPRKEWGGRTRVALVYPNRYRAGMSNLGFLTVHALVNARPGALCERAFLPDPRDAPRGRGGRVAGITLESGRPLADFDVVAFSLSYENDLLNLPAILAAGGVPPLRAVRERSGDPHPLVLAGGFAASLNPEPSGAVADAVVVGDGERAAEAILDLGPPRPRDGGYLAALAAVPGVYVPAGYQPRYDGSRLAALAPRPGFPERVDREAVDLADVPALPVALAAGAELGRMALVETSRGCPQMCGFCAAAHACPAFRAAPLSRARAAVATAWPHRRTVGLVGAAVLDWPPFKEFSREVLARGGRVSPASVRADLVDGEVAEILARSGHRTVALAPECGSEERRRRIGKRAGDEVFFGAAATLVRAGIVSFKLYFLVGVPGAGREEEVDGAEAFARRFRAAVLGEARSLGRIGSITLVLSPFVPKPFTPLQWAPLMPLLELKARQEGIRGALRGVPNVRTDAEPPRTAATQALLSLWDRRAEAALAAARGARIPLDAGPLAEAAADVVFREKGAEEFFPWDVVRGGVPKEVLRRRYEAIAGGGKAAP